MAERTDVKYDEARANDDSPINISWFSSDSENNNDSNLNLTLNNEMKNADLENSLKESNNNSVNDNCHW